MVIPIIMIELSLGQVSGVIALGTFVLQVPIPTAIIVILFGFLRDENTSSTCLVTISIPTTSFHH